MQFTALFAFVVALPLALTGPIANTDVDKDVAARNRDSHARTLEQLFKRVSRLG
jgi:hypothetical protein